MKNQLALPETGFVRLPLVLTFIPISKTTFWQGIKTGLYPAPVRIGARAVAWRCEDIRALIERLGADGAGNGRSG